MLPIEPHWIRHTIRRAAFHSPDNTSITYGEGEKGYIIDRARLQRDVTQWCTGHGAEVRTGYRIVGVDRRNSGYRAVRCADGSTLHGRAVIDASGPSSPFGKDEGFDWKAQDCEPACLAVVDGVARDNDTIHLYVGKNIAPGGYAWLFPSEGTRSNVGLLVGASLKSEYNMRVLLDNFLETHCKDATEIHRCAGMIPCKYTRTTMAKDMLIKAGDSANTVNPISRAGIGEAMLCGTLAARNCVGMLQCSSASALRKAEKTYERQWHTQCGKRQLKLAVTKSALLSIPDEDYNNATHELVKIPAGKLTMRRIFTRALGRFPRLVWALRHLR
jgi:flavin-dependent dehydrogenase